MYYATHPKLRPYQLAGVERLIEITAERHAAILADEPGLGKTIEVAEFINRLEPKTILIVCPASLRINWRSELDRWLTIRPDVTIVSYEGVVSGKVEGLEPDLIVFDEAHYLKSPDAKRTKACLALTAKNRLFLTGTPVVNRPMDIFNILRACGMKMTRKDFGIRYCNGHLSLISWHPRKYAWDFSGASHVTELGNALRKHIMVRRTKAEVLSELPPKIRQVIELDIPHGESRELREAVARMFDGLANAASNIKELKQIAFTELAKARLEIARAKLPHVIALLKDLLGEEEKAVVFAHHREIVEAVATAIPGSVHVYGGMTDRQKDQAVYRFQKCDAPVFVGQIVAAGTGITLTAAHTVLFAELDWVPGNVTQAEDRCHRFGQSLPVRVFHLAARDSVDARMIHALVNKQDVIDALVEKGELE